LTAIQTAKRRSAARPIVPYLLDIQKDPWSELAAKVVSERFADSLTISIRNSVARLKREIIATIDSRSRAYQTALQTGGSSPTELTPLPPLRPSYLNTDENPTMEASFWHERWANNELGWHERDFNPLLVAHFHRLSLPSGSRVLVPLCGKTRDIAWLLQQGFKVAGIELSELAVQQLFAELGATPTITSSGSLQCYSCAGLDVFVGDFFALRAEQLGPVAAIYDRAALVALPPALRERYTRQLMALSGTAPQLLICFDYDQNALAGPPHSVPSAEVWQHYGTCYQLTLADVRAVAGGLKGATPANELVWLLTPLSC